MGLDNEWEVAMKRLVTLGGSIVLGSALLVTAAGALSAGAVPTTRISVSSGGGQGDRDSFAAGISADGRFVVLNSQATDLVPGDTNNRWAVFVHDRTTGKTTRISVTSGGVQAKPTADPWGGSIA